MKRNGIGTDAIVPKEAPGREAREEMGLGYRKKAFAQEGRRVEQERRRSPRYVFFASAQLSEENSDVRVVSRVSELSQNGCYLDMMNPFPTGTMVRLKIEMESAVFEARAKIVYSQPNVGAGVAFVEVDPKHAQVLRGWLEAAAKE